MIQRLLRRCWQWLRGLQRSIDDDAGRSGGALGLSPVSLMTGEEPGWFPIEPAPRPRRRRPPSADDDLAWEATRARMLARMLAQHAPVAAPITTVDTDPTPTLKFARRL